MSFRRLALPTAGAFAMLCWPAFSPLVTACVATSPEAEAATKPNVIVMLLDAQRADALGPYGYKARKTTPNLDKFASGAMVWDNVVSQDAWTVPSVASLFTGVDPQGHRTMRFQVSQRVELDTMSLLHDTMAEQFKLGGYHTGAFIKSTVIDSSRGFSQGFDDFNIVGGKDQAWGQSATQLNDAAIPWLLERGKEGKPFFAYLHYMDPHSPYKPPEPFYSKYKGSYAGKFDGAHLQIEEAFKAGATKPTAEDWEHLHALYDSEIEYWDSEFGRIYAALDGAGMTKNTVLVVLGDHGEAFYEHENIFHGNLYQENIHVPVIMRGPGVKAGRMRAFAQLVDVAPTLADLAGITKGKAWMGQSMVAAMGGGAGHSDCVYSEYVDMRMVVEPSTSLKLMLGDGPDKLFDLKADPAEKNNLASGRAADVTRLRSCADARTAAGKAVGAAYPIEKPKELDRDQLLLLCQLGYVECPK